MAELNQLTNIDNITLTPNNINACCKTADKCFNEAKKQADIGDEERSYVLYMKFVALFQKLKQMTKSKAQDRDFLKQYIGDLKPQKAVQEAEILSDTLHKRYALKLEEEEVRQKLNSMAVEDKEAKEKYAVNGVINKNTKLSNVSSQETGNDKISVKELHQFIISKDQSVLIIDVRDSSSFINSHLRSVPIIHVPDHELKPGMTGKSIAKLLSEDDYSMWNKRGSYKDIVLLDWSSKEISEGDRNKPVVIVLDALTKWDGGVVRCKPRLLEGGYREHIELYPADTTNSKVKIPAIARFGKVENKTSISSVNVITYPSLEPEKLPQDKSNSNVLITTDEHSESKPKKLTPNVPDRSLKPAGGIDAYTSPTNFATLTPSSSSDYQTADVTQPSSGKYTENGATAVQIQELRRDKEFAELSARKLQEIHDLEKEEANEKFEAYEQEIRRLKSEYEKKIGDVEAKDEIVRKLTGISASALRDNRKLQEKDQLAQKMEEVRMKRQQDKEKREEEKKKQEHLKEEERRRRLEKEALRVKVEEEEERKKDEEKRKKDEGEKRKKNEEEKKKKKEGEELLREKEEEKRVAALQKIDRSKKPGSPAHETNIPEGWEKRFDENTKQYTYYDLNTKTYHSKLPMSGKVQAPKTSLTGATVYKERLKDEDDSNKTPQQTGGGLHRSYSSPNIAKMFADNASVTVPSSPIRPSPESLVPSINRQAKPTVNTNVQKMREFNPIYGNRGLALTGLRNLGNTCYMNSSIQCLCNTTLLARYFLLNLYETDINRKNKDGYKGALAEEFAVIIKCMWSGQYRSITPRDFKRVCSRLNKGMFDGHGQQDAHEFMDFLLNGLHEDLNKVTVKPRLPEQDNDKLGLSPIQAAEITWEQHLKHHDSFFISLFKGSYKSLITCTSCGKQTFKFDIFNPTPLELPVGKGSCSLQDCLRQFCKREALTDKWSCPRCKQPRQATREIKFWKLPPIFILNFKRFRNDGIWTNKLQTNVDFPMTNFDPSPFQEAQAERVKPYYLFGVVNHYGSLEGGHYTAYCKNAITQSWYKFDDHEVYDISPSSVKSSAAYVLFYSNVNLPPPTGHTTTGS